MFVQIGSSSVGTCDVSFDKRDYRFIVCVVHWTFINARFVTEHFFGWMFAGDLRSLAGYAGPSTYGSAVELSDSGSTRTAKLVELFSNGTNYINDSSKGRSMFVFGSTS